LNADKGDFPGWPVFDDEQRAAVEAVLQSGRVNYWTGSEARRFEVEYASSLGVKHAVAVANGTVAIEYALQALEIGPGDEVIVPPRTFVATAGAVAIRGAKPVFADLDPLSGNLSAATVEPLLTWRTKAVIAVHLSGWPCEMDPLIALVRPRGIAVIEDCAQSHGAFYRGKPVGALGDIGCFSFCQDKIITTGGEGGLVTTNDAELWKRIWSYKDHGKDWDAVHERKHPGLFKWLHESIGTNGRLTEMQAAIGRIQLRRLPEWSRRRRENAATFDRLLEGTPGLAVVRPPDHVRHAYYKYYAFVDEQLLATGWTRDQLAREIQQVEVHCGPGSCAEIYLEKGLREFAPPSRLPVSRRFGETSLMLHVHPTLEQSHIETMAARVREVFENAARVKPRAVA
jgi:dTDP-4-amino-4,6-dideoxygalactose transaminase